MVSRSRLRRESGTVWASGDSAAVRRESSPSAYVRFCLASSRQLGQETLISGRAGRQFGGCSTWTPTSSAASSTAISTARRGDIAGHKKHLVLTYLTALMIPGIFAFALPGRLMNVMLFG